METGLEAKAGEAKHVTVVLPYQLRQRAGGVRSLDVSARTVRDVIRALDDHYPGLTFNIRAETGELRPFVNVFVGQEDVKYLQGLDTQLENGAVVHIIHSVAGGEARGPVRMPRCVVDGQR